MKTIRLWFCVFMLCCFNSLFAQEEEIGNGLLFPQFEKGVVVFKNGIRSSASFNYNMLQQEMLFQDADSIIMAISNPSEILVVIIGERRFFPTSTKCIFYEEIEAGTGSFFIQRKATELSEGKPAGYGGYSQTSAITSYGTLSGSNTGQVYKLNTNEKFRIKNEYMFYLRSGNSYKKFNSANTLGKLFKGQESKIKEFAKEHSIDFFDPTDVAQIVEYGFSLTNK